MKQLFFALTTLFLGFNSFAQSTDKLVNGYINIKNALVNSNSKAASDAVTSFQAVVKAEASFAQKNELLNAIDKMAKANGIEKQREAFATLSTTLWKTVKGSGKPSAPVYYQYCPMKKAYWLSKEKEIKNPYYGSSMLSCGSVTETLN